MSELNFNLLKKNIKLLMDKHELTQSQFADIIGMTQPNLSKALSHNSSKEFTLDQLYRISQYFKVSLDELTGNTAAVEESTSPATMLTLITKLLCANKIRVIKVEDVKETIYTPYMRGNFPDCAIEQDSRNYHAFYFPDVKITPLDLIEPLEGDYHYDLCCDGNQSIYKPLNEVLDRFLPLVESYRKGNIPADAFQMILEGYVKQLNE